MYKKEIILIGSGGHAISCIDVIESQNQYAIIGLIGSPQEIGSLVCGYPVIGGDEMLPSLAKTIPNAHIALGQIKDPYKRYDFFKSAKKNGFYFPRLISSFAYVSQHATIGSGTIVMHGAIINAGAHIGDNCIINSNVLIEHGTIVGDNCHISTGVILNGDVHIEGESFIGSGSTIKHGVKIGRGSFIGMGSIVLSSTPPKEIRNV
jgi:sugar O-acyltransferase (sialic acid O-acetyltransferase NeuD family)